MVYWWTHLEDGRMDPDVHDQRKLLATDDPILEIEKGTDQLK